MPLFPGFPYPRRHNTLRLHGYGYNCVFQLCAISMVTDLRRPLFADIGLAKSVLACLLSDETLTYMRVRAFTLMPDHLHFLAGVRQPELNLPILIGRFKSYTTQLYWKRSAEVVHSQQVSFPPTNIVTTDPKERRVLLAPLMEWRATLRPEVVELKNWPSLKPGQFLQKRLWQTRLFDHIIRNDIDLQENLDYIAMNPVRAGYVTQAAVLSLYRVSIVGVPRVAAPSLHTNA
jgi:REP element-mobilizing transposase RayT